MSIIQVVLILFGAVTAADENQLPRIAPTESSETAGTFVIHDGFEMQLLAAEPMVTDPVAMEYDEDGRAYVAEMRDYPFTDKAADKPFTEKTTDLPLGRIRLLQDTNGDGVFDSSTVFADELSWPTGLALWKGGLFVVATPDLWYLKDTDGDGRCDVREKLLTGFRKFNVQAVINNLKWGLDHRLYGAGSSNGGQIRASTSSDSRPLVMSTGDFRFQPSDVANSFELLSGGARFGNTFDDWGHRFICNIRNPIQQVVLPRSNLARNPHTAFRSAVYDSAVSGDTVRVWRSSPPEPWRVRNARRLANDPTTVSPRSETVAAGYLTSASGVTIYRGDAYPAQYYGTAFLGEVAGNLIHHQRLTRDGVVYSSRRTVENGEFLASTDNWFRPVNFVNAPDGTLHVLDMYRETIEHPWSIPDDIKALVDLESGRDRGRIYRLAPLDFRPSASPSLGRASTAELVEHLRNPKVWYRETAHRLLFERQEQSAVPLLRTLLTKVSAQTPGSDVVADQDLSAAARLHALWSLQGLQAMTVNDLRAALGDPHFAVRAHAVQLSASRLDADGELADIILILADDPDPAVRYEVAFALYSLLNDQVASSTREAAVGRLATIAVRDAADEFIRAAVLSSVAETAVPVLKQILSAQQPLSADVMTVLQELTLVVAMRGLPEEYSRFFSLVDSLSSASDETEVVANLTVGFGKGVRRKGKSLTDVLVAEAKTPGAQRMLKTLSNAVADVATKLSVTAEGSSVGSSERQLTAELIGFAEFEAIRPAIENWLAADQPVTVQSAAVRSLGSFRQDEIAGLLINSYRGLRSSARAEAVELLVSRREWHPALLAAIESGTIALFDVPQLRRNLLLRSSDADVKDRAVALFTASMTARKDVVDQYRDAVPKLKPDPAQGAVVYRRECQVCHRLGSAGQELGPNLVTIRNRAPDEVLLHILDPNREVAPNFVAQVIVTDEGQILTGLITDETDHQLLLRQSSGTTTILTRNRIAEMTSTGQSLMPVGLEQKISAQEMADLLDYLLNQPLTEAPGPQP